MSSLGASRSPPFRAPGYRCAEALAADGGLVVPEDLPDGASGVEAFSQQQGSIEEEEGGRAIDDVLKSVDAAGERSGQGCSGAGAVPGSSAPHAARLGQPGCSDLPSLCHPRGTETEGEAARGASQGKAVASEAVGHCQLPRTLHTYPVQRSSTSQGT